MFCVAPGNEIVSSGPYFLTAYEALAWAFHYYALVMPSAWPSRVEWDEDLPLFPQPVNWEPPSLLAKSFYNDLPPVLIEVRLDRDYEYSTEFLEDQEQKFDKNAYNLNADNDTMTRTLKNFYNPKNLSVLHESKLGLYEIYMRIQYESIEGVQRGTKPDKSFIDAFKYDRLFRSKSNKPFFWRRYQAIRLSSPQNAIQAMARSNLDWPTMLLKFVNYFTATGECDYSKFESYLLQEFPKYIVFVDLRTFGLQTLDANLLYVIAEKLQNRYDFIHLMSINNKTRRIFNTNVRFRNLFYSRFCRSLKPDFFSMSVDETLPLYYTNIALSKNEGKLGRFGLVADGSTLSDLPKDLMTSNEQFTLIENCNSYFTMVGMCLSCCWDKRNNLTVSLRGKGGMGMINRTSYVPFALISGKNMFARTNKPDPVGAINNMTINASWAFDFPSGCMQNTDMSTAFLVNLQENALAKGIGVIDSKVTLFLHNTHNLEMEISVRVMSNANRTSSFECVTGPYYGFSNDSDSPFNRKLLRSIKERGVEILVKDVTVALNPYQILEMNCDNPNTFISIIYPYLNYAVRYTIINKEIMRADITGEFN